MEPGDLRINQFHPKEKNFQGVNRVGRNEEALYLGYPPRPVLHHYPPTSVASLVPDRNQPVKIWRDPQLIASSDIRHVDSSLHNNFAHRQPDIRGPMPDANSIVQNAFNQHSRGSRQSVLTSTGGIVTEAQSMPLQLSIRDASRPIASLPQSDLRDLEFAHALSREATINPWRDVAPESVVPEKRYDAKRAAEQAVHQHFEESFRASQMKNTYVTPRFGTTEQDFIVASRMAGEKRYYGPPPPSMNGPMYQNAQGAHASKKSELPVPPPLTNECIRSEVSRPQQQHQRSYYTSRQFDANEGLAMGLSPKPDYGKDPGDYGKPMYPAVDRQVEVPRELERHFYQTNRPFVSKGAAYNFPSSHGSPLNRVKVNSPAPPQIYGKPSIPSSSARQFESQTDFAPLSLTSKITTRPYETAPITSPTSLPKHEIRTADLTSLYMYDNPQSNFHDKTSKVPLSQVQQFPQGIQTQPLDLGGKRKSESEPIHALMYPKKIKIERNDEFPHIKMASRSSSGKLPASSSISIAEGSLPLDVHGALDGVTLLATVSQQQKPVPVPVVIPPPAIPLQPVLSELPSKSCSPAPATTPVSSVSRLSSIPTKVPKKAWVQQWHNGEDGATIADIPIKSAAQPSGVQESNQCATNNPNEATNIDHDQKRSDRKAASLDSGKNESKSKRVASNSRKKNEAKGVDGVVNGHKAAANISSSESESDNAKGSKGKSRVKPLLSRDKVTNVADDSVTASEESSGLDESFKEKGSPLTQSQPQTGKSRRRGRKAASSVLSNSKIEKKKSNPFKRPPINLLKKTGESFLQDGSCSELTAKLGKCRECRWTPSNKSKKQSNIFCRFYAFRKLRYTKNGVLAIAGFSDPYEDPKQEDYNLWLPSENNASEQLTVEMSKVLLAQLGDHVCELVRQENEAVVLSNLETSSVSWKRVVQGVREMCDVCDTTLFNFHWACGKCGFVVCISCYKTRKSGNLKVACDSSKDKDDFQWLFCTNRQAHEIDKLTLTQVIAGDALRSLGRSLHEVRKKLDIPQSCKCPLVSPFDKLSLDAEEKNSSTCHEKSHTGTETDGEHCTNNSSNGVEQSTLRNLLVVKSDTKAPESNDKNDESSQQCIENPKETIGSVKSVCNVQSVKDDKFCEKSVILYPSISHSWMCSNTVLRFHEPDNELNNALFRDVWKDGHPVVVSNVNAKLTPNLWTPDSFARDFGDTKHDLVNCLTDKVVTNQPMKKFWDGFLNASKRLKDTHGIPMLLKLKDWPPGEDFAEVLPERFKDIVSALPLAEYTSRSGHLNLASRLPENFVKPDLGPKLYIAYGSALSTDKATTNLHMDISDAVNVLVYASVCTEPDTANAENIAKATSEIMKEDDCGDIYLDRLKSGNEIPGAMWHIYHNNDVEKIRDFLLKVGQERGYELESDSDTIHDQNWYLDASLRKRLKEEYNVIGYTIVQFVGDAIFIPAGAPHQVRNINQCIKLASDFVSPENVGYCFRLTEEFRNLSDTHVNREDKLQIKNIMYHAVKDALSVLLCDLKGQSSRKTDK